MSAIPFHLSGKIHHKRSKLSFPKHLCYFLIRKNNLNHQPPWSLAVWWWLLLRVLISEQMVEAGFAIAFEWSVACNEQTTSSSISLLIGWAVARNNSPLCCI